MKNRKALYIVIVNILLGVLIVTAVKSGDIILWITSVLFFIAAWGFTVSQLE